MDTLFRGIARSAHPLAFKLGLVAALARRCAASQADVDAVCTLAWHWWTALGAPDPDGPVDSPDVRALGLATLRAVLRAAARSAAATRVLTETRVRASFLALQSRARLDDAMHVVVAALKLLEELESADAARALASRLAECVTRVLVQRAAQLDGIRIKTLLARLLLRWPDALALPPERLVQVCVEWLSRIADSADAPVVKCIARLSRALVASWARFASHDAAIDATIQAVFGQLLTDAPPSRSLGFVVRALPADRVDPTAAIVCAPAVADDVALRVISRIVSWPLVPPLVPWAIAFMTQLRNHRRVQVIGQLAMSQSLSVAAQLVSRPVREGALQVLGQLLLLSQNNAALFLGTLPALLDVTHDWHTEFRASLPAEPDAAAPATQPSEADAGAAPAEVALPEAAQHILDRLLQPAADLLQCMMVAHPGHPELYASALSLLAELPSTKLSDAAVTERLEAFRIKLPPSSSPSRGSQRTAASLDPFEAITPRDPSVPTGLVNAGASCYMNSILQALAFSDDFVAALVAPEFWQMRAPDEHTAPAVADPSLSPTTLAARRVLATMLWTARSAVLPSPVIEALRSMFSPVEQSDAGELYRALLDAVDTECRAQRNRAAPAHEAAAAPLTSSLFGGVMHSDIECSACHTVSANEVPFFDLALPALKNVPSLDDALRALLAPEPLNGDNRYRCSTCGGQLRDATRTASIETAPRHLLVTLNRIAYDVQARKRVKVMTDMAFPQLLSLPLRDGRVCAYDLYAVVVHSGRSAEHGHYYTYARHSRARGAQWWLLNDARASTASPRAFEAFSRQFGSDVAFALLYVAHDAAHDGDVVAADAPTHVDAALRDAVLEANREFERTWQGAQDGRSQRRDAQRRDEQTTLAFGNALSKGE